jgi:predicted nucleic acid-binding protein
MALSNSYGIRVTRFLLDTNVVSELRKTKPHGAVLAWMGGIASEQIFLSAVTFGEMQSGVERTRLPDLKKGVLSVELRGSLLLTMVEERRSVPSPPVTSLR